MVVRTYGEVRLAMQTNPITPFEARSCLHQEAKRAIAREAAKQIEEGDSIILDSGTTTIEIAKLLVNRSNLNVFTNSLPIATTFSNSAVSVNLLGGMLLGRNLSVLGPEAEEYLSRIEVNKAFISAPGTRVNYGLVTSHPLEASIKKSMVIAAKTVYAVLDSSKLDLPSIYPFAPFSDLHFLITEKPVVNPTISAALAAAGVTVLEAEI